MRTIHFYWEAFFRDLLRLVGDTAALRQCQDAPHHFPQCTMRKLMSLVIPAATWGWRCAAGHRPAPGLADAPYASQCLSMLPRTGYNRGGLPTRRHGWNAAPDYEARNRGWFCRIKSHCKFKISGRNWPTYWAGSFLSSESGTMASRSTWPSAKVTLAFWAWRKWPLG